MPLVPESIGLPGRVAVVTGAAMGIGRATAVLFARAGARLALCDRAGDELAATASAVAAAGAGAGADDPLVGVFDVREPDAVEAFVGQVGERYGRVDVLVNNVGGTFVAPFLGTSVRAEAALIAENFTQATSFVRHVAPLMPEGGSIVNVTSIEAHQAAPGFAVYAAMKTGLASLTKTLALELAPRGIRVNAVAPDGVGGGDDDLRETFLASDVPYAPPAVPPLGRFGEPADAAAAILFLAGELARFVTGTTVHVDGGTHAAGGWHRRT
jgi:3-oxoacyl-[acyl-carrier protein] reductase